MLGRGMKLKIYFLIYVTSSFSPLYYLSISSFSKTVGDLKLPSVISGFPGTMFPPRPIKFPCSSRLRLNPARVAEDPEQRHLSPRWPGRCGSLSGTWSRISCSSSAWNLPRAAHWGPRPCTVATRRPQAAWCPSSCTMWSLVPKSRPRWPKLPSSSSKLSGTPTFWPTSMGWRETNGST